MGKSTTGHKELAHEIRALLSENLKENLRVSEIKEGDNITFCVLNSKIKDAIEHNSIATISLVCTPKFSYYKVQLNPSNSKAELPPASFVPIILSCLRSDTMLNELKKMFAGVGNNRDMQ